eukprot:6200553-Pleurochrysis_carterae.AAC.2
MLPRPIHPCNSSLANARATRTMYGKRQHDNELDHLHAPHTQSHEHARAHKHSCAHSPRAVSVNAVGAFAGMN